uniref:Uncharacterized protein n=1 Tax=Utricularia reniformis TaxID=192314 RepID=A0A1Y0B3H4_9LAMI|nr:hypothetical protein AEK19_MT1788 [Utricularia reniformis]ART31961.1 hypothetical protein AEK19_MT1788 [Utricularia reniformis]
MKRGARVSFLFVARVASGIAIGTGSLISCFTR